jgi:hypothetical protein
MFKSVLSFAFQAEKDYLYKEGQFLIFLPNSLIPSFASLAGGRWFSPGTLETKNKTDRRDMTEILLKVVLSAMTIIL